MAAGAADKPAASSSCAAKGSEVGGVSDNVAGSSNGSGVAACKQKHKTDTELILVMEPQNPSPTKYFDQNGLPLRKDHESIDLQLVSPGKHIPKGAGVTAPLKRRTKLTITCHNCAKCFDSRHDYEQHYRKTYGGEPVYACSVCDKRISQYKAYRLHAYRHTNSASARYACATCHKSFHQRSDLTRHEIIHEATPAMAPGEPIEGRVSSPQQLSLPGSSSSKQKVACDRCEALFESLTEFRGHVKKMHPLPKQMIECPECGKFLSAGSLYSHRKIHSDGPKFTCEQCDKSFVQKINFIHHRKKHLPNGERPFPCGKCGKAFFERSHLQRHQFFHSEERPYKCEACGKCYKTERCLKVHSAVHQSERPFVCAECNKGFLSSSKLRQHSNIHSGLRPFKCKYCARDFTNFPNWLKHIRRRHKVDHRTGETLASVPKFMTKTKQKQKELQPQDPSLLPPPPPPPAPSSEPALPRTDIIIKEEESLPSFAGENSNIDLDLVSKDDLLQPLKMEEMEDIFLAEIPGSGGGVGGIGGGTAPAGIDISEEARLELPPLRSAIRRLQHPKPTTSGVETVKLEAKTAVQSATLLSNRSDSPAVASGVADDEESLLPPPPPLGLAVDDSELFPTAFGGYDQPEQEFDCDFSIKHDFPLRADADNVILEREAALDHGLSSTVHRNGNSMTEPLPRSAASLLFDINNELAIFPTLISICGDEQQRAFQLINPHILHLPAAAVAAAATGVSASTPGTATTASAIQKGATSNGLRVDLP